MKYSEMNAPKMPQKIIDLCQSAAELNYSGRYRKGSLVSLENIGELIVTGDLHGHRRNFERITAYADLENNPQTAVVFQEILHGGPEDDYGGCVSFLLFFDVLRYQLKFPDQVYLILGNHDTAIITENNVLKSGREMNQAMQEAMKRLYLENSDDVYAALKQCLISQPLAVKCPNGIWVSHSLPADKYVADFDATAFDRPLEIHDMARSEPAYLLTWGRRHSQEALDELANKFGVDLFILGHQAQQAGWKVAGDNLIILASDHNHGCLVAFDPKKAYSIDKLADCVVPLASIA